MFLEVSMDYGDDTVLLSETTHTSEDWNQMEVYLAKRQTAFHLAVKSRPDVAGDLIAIDDFAMVDCQLPTPNPDGCNDDKFSCGNSKQI